MNTFRAVESVLHGKRVHAIWPHRPDSGQIEQSSPCSRVDTFWLPSCDNTVRTVFGRLLWNLLHAKLDFLLRTAVPRWDIEIVLLSA